MITTAIFGADFILIFIFIADVYLYICDCAPSKVNQATQTLTQLDFTPNAFIDIRSISGGNDSKVPIFPFRLFLFLFYCHICFVWWWVCAYLYRESIDQIHSELFRFG